jgi:prepilin-type processing-associated H-X9-DG protein
MLPNVRTAGSAARRMQCQNNLKQIALALLTYESRYHALPPAYTVDSTGKPLHSWRTLILPFLEQQNLYDTIDLTKPWNDPVNAKACEVALPVYHCPEDRGPLNHTTYFANVASNGCFHLTEPRKISKIDSAGSKTLMVVEVPPDRSVPWMAPNDADEALILRIRPDSKLDHDGRFNAAMCDGSVHTLDADLPAADRKAMISSSGHDKTDERAR